MYLSSSVHNLLDELALDIATSVANHLPKVKCQVSIIYHNIEYSCSGDEAGYHPSSEPRHGITSYR